MKLFKWKIVPLEYIEKLERQINDLRSEVRAVREVSKYQSNEIVNQRKDFAKELIELERYHVLYQETIRQGY